VAFSHQDVDIATLPLVRDAIAAHRPWAVINAAGYTRVDDAERERQQCHLVNAVGPAVLAFACRQAGIELLTFSSDQVFDGSAQRPYLESDPVAPLNVYGCTTPQLTIWRSRVWDQSQRSRQENPLRTSSIGSSFPTRHAKIRTIA
jgi:dTDP-4-dehydrorhamnose reductase